MSSTQNTTQKYFAEFKDFVVEKVKEREKEHNLKMVAVMTAYTGIIEKIQEQNNKMKEEFEEAAEHNNKQVEYASRMNEHLHKENKKLQEENEKLKEEVKTLQNLAF